VRLYSFAVAPSPLKARLALAELQLDYELIEVNLLAWEQHSPEFKRLNPHGKVPVLDDDGFVIRESSAICAYLGRTYGSGRLWPDDARLDALALQWLFFEASHLMAPLTTLYFSSVVSPLVGLPGSAPEVLEDNESEISRSLDVLEGQLEKGPWVLGDAFTLVDCCVGVAASLLLRTRLEKPERWPRVFDYGARVRGRPSWSQAFGEALMALDPRALAKPSGAPA
jgi:glutathione S-transferase